MTGAGHGPWAARVARDVVRVSGGDATAYLQGQLSQDLDTIAEGASAWSLVLEPQGRVASWFRITRRADHWLCDLDAGHGPDLVARLERFRLRVDVEIELVGGWEMVAIRGTGGEEPTPHGDTGIVARVNWPGFEGTDLVGPSPRSPVRELDPVWLERHRLAAAFPRLGAEITAATIPAEAGVVETAVSFTKGCYVGQELVARIDSRGGRVPRPVRLLVTEQPVEVGTAVTDSGDRVGEVTSAVDAVLADGRRVGLALAPLARRVGEGAALRAGTVPARLVTPPVALAAPGG